MNLAILPPKFVTHLLICLQAINHIVIVIMVPFVYSFNYTCLVIRVTDFQASHVDPRGTCYYLIKSLPILRNLRRGETCMSALCLSVWATDQVLASFHVCVYLLMLCIFILSPK